MGVVPGSSVLSSPPLGFGSWNWSRHVAGLLVARSAEEVGSSLSVVCLGRPNLGQHLNQNGNWASVHSDRRGRRRPRSRAAAQQSSSVVQIVQPHSFDRYQVGNWIVRGQLCPGIGWRRPESRSKYPACADGADYVVHCADLRLAVAIHTESLAADSGCCFHPRSVCSELGIE